jgi:dTDP-4-dehydrorhamnose 3,5-epimerase
MLLERRSVGDDRGHLERLFCSMELSAFMHQEGIAQSNLTHTKRPGTLRGLHMQEPPYSETKIVTCIQGKVWDVAVDMRQGSPTFLRWHAVELSGSNRRSLLIPKGFAHGFQTLTDDCTMIYFHSALYTPSAERGFDAFDPRLGIRWPQVTCLRSDRDKGHAAIPETFQGYAT